MTTFRVLHEDAALVAIEKPSGILVHRSPESRDRVFVLQQLAAQLERHLYPVHRLDRATSGVLLFAFSSEDARALQTSLQSDTSEKRYLALVRGEAPERFTQDRPLTDHDTQGKPKREARTDFVRRATFARCSLLEATLHTGRRHQIRRHCHHSGHQVIGDTTYGKGRINRALREEFGLPRLCLHAWSLVFDHPRSGERTTVRSPLATDLREFFLRLPDAPVDLIGEL